MGFLLICKRCGLEDDDCSCYSGVEEEVEDD